MLRRKMCGSNNKIKVSLRDVVPFQGEVQGPSRFYKESTGR